MSKYEEEVKMLKEATNGEAPINVNFSDDGHINVGICYDMSPQMLQTMLTATLHASYNCLTDKATESGGNLLRAYLTAFDQITEVFDRFIDDKKEIAELHHSIDMESEDEEEGVLKS